MKCGCEIWVSFLRLNPPKRFVLVLLPFKPTKREFFFEALECLFVFQHRRCLGFPPFGEPNSLCQTVQFLGNTSKEAHSQGLGSVRANKKNTTTSTCLSHLTPLCWHSLKGAQVITDRHKGGPFHWSCLFSQHLTFGVASYPWARAEVGR